jgi:DMSO/TMAO reductase YedYZ molybdopterin-dependent catalytic subunit
MTKVTDIHCVTRWSKLDTKWEGIPFSWVMETAKPKPEAKYIMLHCEHGFTVNVPLEDCLSDEVTMLAYKYDELPLEPDHGYPLRFLLPHLYFWKSAKWIRTLEFLKSDEPGFWEQLGYHIYGDPWQEQRYAGD